MVRARSLWRSRPAQLVGQQVPGQQLSCELCCKDPTAELWPCSRHLSCTFTQRWQVQTGLKLPAVIEAQSGRRLAPSVAVRSTAMRLRVIFRLSAKREASAYVTWARSLYEGLKSCPPCLVFCLNYTHTGSVSSTEDVSWKSLWLG